MSRWERIKLWYGGFGYIIGWKIEGAYYVTRSFFCGLVLGHKSKTTYMELTKHRAVFYRCVRCDKKLRGETK